MKIVNISLLNSVFDKLWLCSDDTTFAETSMFGVPGLLVSRSGRTSVFVPMSNIFALEVEELKPYPTKEAAGGKQAKRQRA